jgi:hypothetical protein
MPPHKRMHCWYQSRAGVRSRAVTLLHRHAAPMAGDWHFTNANNIVALPIPNPRIRSCFGEEQRGHSSFVRTRSPAAARSRHTEEVSLAEGSAPLLERNRIGGRHR